MRIELSNAGKRFNREWIFRHIDHEFLKGQSYAITGSNGSGKSTLLQTICGMLQASEGSIELYNSDKKIEPEKTFSYISFCAPYLDVIEEMTLREFFNFHSFFKPFKKIKIEEVAAIVGLTSSLNKEIRNFSSGMKQRVKLAQAVFSDVPVVLLDEPCSNLDAKGIELYHSLISNYCKDRLVIVCSNDEVEYNFCQHVLRLEDFK